MLRHLSILCAFLAVVVTATTAQGQIAYGVNANGVLFRFDVSDPSNVSEIGNVGFVPQGIDFRPGTETLYAIQVGPNTTQLYTLNTNTAAPTPVGAGFASTGLDYNLTGNQTFGFDFNPKTLQADDSMRIRLTSTGNANLRLHSATGQIAAVDGNLMFGSGDSPFVDGSAYINNVPEMGGITALYNIDSRNDSLLLQSPPNDGIVSTVGLLGFDAFTPVGFDIFTTPGNMDPTVGGDHGLAVFQFENSDSSEGFGGFMLYDIDLATGAANNPRIIGSIMNPYDFDGGFAVNPVPEPLSLPITTLVVVGLWFARRRHA